MKCSISTDIKISTFTKLKKKNYKTVLLLKFLDFPGVSDGKKSTCNVGDLGFLHWEDPLEEGMATHSSIIAWRMAMDRGAWWATVHGVARSWTGQND